MSQPLIIPPQSFAPLSGNENSQTLFNLQWWLFFNNVAQVINAGALVPVVGGLNTEVLFNDSGFIGGDTAFTFIKSTGVVNATQFCAFAVATDIAFQITSGDWQVDGNGNSQSQSTSTAAFQTPNGGVTSKYLIGTTSLSLTEDTAAHAGLSVSGMSRLFMDSSDHYLKLSVHGGAYDLQFASGGNMASLSTSTAAIQAPLGGMTAKYLIATTSVSWTQDSSANYGPTSAGNGRIALDSSLGYFVYSENGGAYARCFGGGGGSPGGANTNIQFNDSAAFGGQANFNFVKATGVASAVQWLGTATTTNIAFQNAAGSWQVDGNGNSQSQSTSTAAFQTPNGGVTSKYLVATTSVSWIGDTAANAGPTTSGNGRIYFDSTLNYFLYSENGGAYARAFGTGSVAGSNTQIQYNNSGAFGASSDFTWNNSTKVLTVTGSAVGSVMATFANGIVNITGTSTAAVNVPNGGTNSLYITAVDSYYIASTLNLIVDSSGGFHHLSSTYFTEISAPSASASGFSKIYADSTTHKLRLSQNTGAYSNILTLADLAAGTGLSLSGSTYSINLTGGTGVNISGATISIGQAVATSSSPTFVAMTLTDVLFGNNASTSHIFIHYQVSGVDKLYIYANGDIATQGTINSVGGYIANGIAGESATINIAGLTSITVRLGIITGHA